MSTAVTRFTRFDLVTLARTQPLRVLLPLAFTVVFCLTLPVPGFGIVVGAAVAAVSASIPFQNDERGRLDALYGTAPVGRTVVVIGRYVTMAVLALVMIAVGTATTLVVREVRGQDFGWPLVATMLLAAVACVGIAFAVQLPWFFALGYTRGRPMIYIPIGVLAVVGFVAGRVGWFDGVGPAEVLTPSPLVASLVLLGVVALVVASALVAIRVYQRREL